MNGKEAHSIFKPLIQTFMMKAWANKQMDKIICHIQISIRTADTSQGKNTKMINLELFCLMVKINIAPWTLCFLIK